ncbi:MAG: hypothetical protein COA84_07620 [Robiginitomaculum sp.]|nr:MAG: hypothetical protein COA84_07620 [Robiginitomaculum sp.]
MWRLRPDIELQIMFNLLSWDFEILAERGHGNGTVGFAFGPLSLLATYERYTDPELWAVPDEVRAQDWTES